MAIHIVCTKVNTHSKQTNKQNKTRRIACSDVCTYVNNICSYAHFNLVKNYDYAMTTFVCYD
jgi:hypothetical protein